MSPLEFVLGLALSGTSKAAPSTAVKLLGGAVGLRLPKKKKTWIAILLSPESRVPVVFPINTIQILALSNICRFRYKTRGIPGEISESEVPPS